MESTEEAQISPVPSFKTETEPNEVTTGPKSNPNVEQDPGTPTKDETTYLPSSIPSTLPSYLEKLIEKKLEEKLQEKLQEINSKPPKLNYFQKFEKILFRVMMFTLIRADMPDLFLI